MSTVNQNSFTSTWRKIKVIWSECKWMLYQIN